ncbi:hypothetical protein OS242_20990 [Tumebacillus sp. DT12]|uniref:Uncharacterized protein n=1 Tax=Tumebacillus lacus TaxID=2995335 RepID=A0ABT3XC95_9BACL|nr:hypothetical protein [Tumebacillus lacus]MCX7572389.1 hypothetical protein [Tumebacillus lacus]
MKYTYEPEILDMGDHRRLFFKLPDEIKLVEVFLGIEIQSMEGDGEFFLEAIERVLMETDEIQVVHGNVVALEILKGQTHVVEMLADDGLGNACYIETEELKKLIYVWLDELEKFNQDQKA